MNEIRNSHTSIATGPSAQAETSSQSAERFSQKKNQEASLNAQAGQAQPSAAIGSNPAPTVGQPNTSDFPGRVQPPHTCPEPPTVNPMPERPLVINPMPEPPPIVNPIGEEPLKPNVDSEEDATPSTKKENEDSISTNLASMLSKI